MTEYRSNVDKLIAQDITSLKDAQDIFDSLANGVKGSRSDNARQVLSSCRPLRLMLDGGMSQVNVKTSFPGCASYVSKGHTVTQLCSAIANGDTDPKVLEALSNLQVYADHQGMTRSAVSMCGGLLADDGSKHAQAVADIYATFGALEYFYKIATGVKFHADDPRNNQDDEPQGDEESGEESGDSPSVSGEELIARGVRKMRESGATDQAIADYFMAVIGGK